MAFNGERDSSAAERCLGWRWEADSVRDSCDVIAAEAALALLYNGRPYVVMMVTPQDIEDFVLGFSVSEGVVHNAGEVESVRVRPVPDGIEADVTIPTARFRELDRKQRNLTGRIGCGLCGAQTLAQAVRHPRPVARTAAMPAVALQQAMSSLAERQPLNAATGAVHAAAWVAENGEIVLVREDVGRHNALDKLIGAMLREKRSFHRGAALITSRASHEMIQKAATVGIEIVCAISAPTTLAIRVARETGVTLIAFARGDRHTTYTHPHRLTYKQQRVAV
jgi:FdhD protein